MNRPHIARSPYRRRIASLVVGVIACSLLLCAPGARAERMTLDKPVRISAAKTDKTKLVGRVTGYDQTSFEMIKGADEKVEVKWSELDALNVFLVRSAMITKPDAQAWIALRDLRAVPDGEKQSEIAFNKALRIDPKLKDAVEAARKEEIKPPAPAGGETGKPMGGADDGGTAGGNADPANPGAAAGPRMIGQATERTWKILSDDEQAAAVKEHEAFAAKTQETMKIELVRHETKFFLFYSDLSPSEAKKWADLLDRMYARLSDLFATGKGVNVWRGKALVFVFMKAQDYHRFQRLMHSTDSNGSAGMCHSFGNGDVHIAFYRQPEELMFAHVLVHESVHGFLHRFKTPIPIPSWVNEGLAETISSELVPRAARANEVAARAKAGMRQFGGMGNILEAAPITGWQYPVAESLTTFMIKQKKKGYVDFVMGIKEGLTWEESLDQKYKVKRELLVKVYGESMGIKNLAE